MRLVNVNSIMPGEVLAMPVKAGSGKTILNSGITLNEIYSGKLKAFGIDKVYIVDERFADVEVTESLDSQIMASGTKVLAYMNNAVRNNGPLDEYCVKDVAKDIVDYARGRKDKTVGINFMTAKDEHIIEHSMNVALLSAFVGLKMSLNHGQLCDLVTGALIHDMGRENRFEESPEHVAEGFEALRKCRGLSLHSSIVCYEHHERFDGGGYPRKLNGSAITQFSRVVSAADRYDMYMKGMGNNGVRIMPDKAFDKVASDAGTVLDPGVIEIMKDTVIFFPNGSTVLLSNGKKGVVIRQNPGNPRRPVVRLFDEEIITGEIDLLERMSVYIKDVLVV